MTIKIHNIYYPLVSIKKTKSFWRDGNVVKYTLHDEKDRTYYLECTDETTATDVMLQLSTYFDKLTA